MRKGGTKILLIALLGVLLVLSPLTLRIPAQTQTSATVTIEDRSASAGATTVVRISISGVPSPGLGEMSVGPKGEFAYDPQVMIVLDVVGVSPYTVTSKSIDNDIGRVRFTASAPERGAKTEGRVVELEVQAVGNPGESTPLRITRIDAFRDPKGADIPYTIRDGTFTIRLVPNEPPRAEFTFSPERPAAGDLVQFTDRSSDPDGKVVSWEWDFGDGTTSTKQNPTHRYREAGIFTIRLTVTDDVGDIGRATQEVVVAPAPPNQPPLALFTFSPARPTTEDTIQFTDKSSDPDGEITFRFWDFGDGSNSTEENPTHKYAESGRYTVTLTVVDNRGATDSFSREVVVTKVAANQPPQAAFTFSPSNPAAGDIIKFRDQSSDPDGRVVFWFWSFGDGATSTLKDPSHRYKAPGTYTVTLRVADDEGATGVTTRQLTVSPGPAGRPQADFTFSPENPKPGEAVQFTDRSIDPDGEIVAWEWDFGDGKTSKEQNPSHKYAKRGVYTVKLTVTDNDGLSDSITKEITVGHPKPQVVVHCYPNPASTQTTFRYTLPDGTAKATLFIFDLTGRLVLQQELAVTAGEYRWDLRSDSGEDLPNGPYFYYVRALGGDGQTVGRSVLRKLLIQRG